MKNNIEITAVGDITFSRDIEKYIQKNNNDYTYPLSYVKSYFKNSDISIANLETSLSNKNFINCKSKKFYFKSKPAAIEGIVNSGIDIVNLANNHTTDTGIEGLNNTVNILNKNKISIIGTESQKYIIKTINNIKIGFIGLSNKFYSKNLKNLNVLEKKYILNYKNKQLIQKLRKKVDILIVSIHWGNEYEKEIELQKKLAFQMISLGVNLILGNHPHVIQKMDYIKTKMYSGYVFYSLGNFLFDSHKNKKGVRNTFILKINIDKNKKMKFSYLPCIIYPNLGYAPLPSVKKFQNMYPKFSTKKAEDLYKYIKCSRTASCKNIENFNLKNKKKNKSKKKKICIIVIVIIIMLIILFNIKI